MFIASSHDIAFADVYLGAEASIYSVYIYSIASLACVLEFCTEDQNIAFADAFFSADASIYSVCIDI